jgi:hypothetical protein
MTLEEIEDVKSVMQMPGFKLIMKELDVIVDRIQGSVLSVPLDKDPAKAQLELYISRMKFEGANATKLAFQQTLKAIKER